MTDPQHPSAETPAYDDDRTRERIIAPVIVSTRAAQGVREDQSAPIIAEFADSIDFGCRPPVIIPDGEGVLAAISELLVQVAPAVIITSGGTGLTPDDLTPEYTLPLLDKEIPGIMEAVRAHGRAHNPLAALSRGMAGVAEGTVIVNLPGSPKAVREGMQVLVEILPHLCDQVSDLRKHDEWGSPGDQ
ncbi:MULTISPECIES: MogA/MoaB family molybdenum cofactor biosynthesis protein [Nesterenkonia]|uniref:Molybdenum cofactor synthesis domain-containing protein n=1 Tax=Nesterenkonia xinjiangensis TaxID=225327 RepID=A0A7Z0GPY3_9MICC|nr:MULTISPECIES: MogA/MoaB family molybdenum cofactor biosynthesis protein [Nesterenkonia]MDZ5076076.1 MogA/MoaB family molybdenum cofactor biosynthesis protein [Nesterenkonia sp. HG001]NYJ79141.1 molybdenum cofactor synthesis domain-containing protein [Nesterenkonia xinjiangensis]